MSALVTPGILRELEEERNFSLDPNACCRFCGCTEDTACEIFFAQGGSETWRLVATDAEADYSFYCSWYVPGVCNHPECLEKLLLESRNRVVIFDAHGRRTG
jgi:hypothetical protein